MASNQGVGGSSPSGRAISGGSGTVHYSGKTITRFDVWMPRQPSDSMRVRANKFREVEGEGAAWYASRTEAVGLGRAVPSSFYCFPLEVFPSFGKHPEPRRSLSQTLLFDARLFAADDSLLLTFILPWCDPRSITRQNPNLQMERGIKAAASAWPAHYRSWGTARAGKPAS